MSPEVLADDGCHIWAAQAGDGPSLVFCHGGPGLWDYFDETAALLGDFVRIVRWDQRGCGRSERRGPYMVARFVADLDAVRQHLGASRVSLLGHSWGAMLALRYALDHPDRVSRLIYVSGTGVDPEDTWRPMFHRDIEQRIGADAERWKDLRNRNRTPAEDRELAILQWSADFVDPAKARQHAERLCTPWLGINYECANSVNAEVRQYLRDHDVPARCRSLTVPTLIVDGEQDLRPRWAVDSLAQALPHVQRVTLTGAGHMPWVEDPDGFRQAVAGFLAADDHATLDRVHCEPPDPR
ncbi:MULTISPECIES: alpha/beta fold hydrolase [Micromonospora]|uniref:alpha/beta fold hydrolase n=1 Tax=Micromonospora TaxID=1873 RepID=UPI0034348579